jgi:Arc/MetJ-type ribon-helix-helix transcriptional regulator
MGVDKFSISLPTDLLEQIDEIVRDEGSSRSGVIREAAAAYVAARASETYEAERKQRIDEALEGFDSIAELWGPDDRSGLELLAELRGEGSGTDTPEAGPGRG